MQTLSKSKLMASLQCPKQLWLEVHMPHLKEQSSQAEALFATGHAVGSVARKIYDLAACGTTLDIATDRIETTLLRTVELCTKSTPIFEAGFKAGGALVVADVLLPDNQEGASSWRLVEVKSSTSVKDHHRDELAIQAVRGQII